MQWNNCTTQLCPGDLVCLYTNGVSEAGLEVSNQFGKDRILESLKRGLGISQEALDKLLHSCRSFVRNQPFEDDWTAVILKISEWASDSR